MGVPPDAVEHFFYKLKPLTIRGYNDGRTSMQLLIPNEADIGEDNAHLFTFTRYQRLFYEALEAAIHTYEANLADGFNIREALERLSADWREASVVLTRLTKFGIEFTDHLSAGPGPSSMPKCSLCRNKTVHGKGADLCSTCLITILETPKEGR